MTTFRILMTGSTVLGGIGLLTAVLVITNTPSYPSLPPSTEAIDLMTQHLKLHHQIDTNMAAQHDMISRIVDVLDKIMMLRERKAK
ncbi:hypothetical protein LCGC14_2798720 [marine sediment metagenome]|uniref:Uncharacterized protein n=1 Tax=marine sediment metagenome TaxID=412755 RepID=A0A0F9BER2_9ZZZZ